MNTKTVAIDLLHGEIHNLVMFLLTTSLTQVFQGKKFFAVLSYMFILYFFID